MGKMNTNRLALVIPLQGSILETVCLAWQTLDNGYEIRHISDKTPCPHITLAAGEVSGDLHALSQRIQSICEATLPFSIQATGLGVLAEQTPLIYIRWGLSNSLINL